ncbi:transcriptional activator NhaR [Desulfosediminicola flagellatus]|uniref:transcriptional activator NhaR n=1 Tax=Desulfosediminicola flagellatus TaxID=2569541 RepID=UPI0010AB9061|nr:transcriptional activator NhaR [Desulfosediminicola flagellatus]
MWLNYHHLYYFWIVIREGGVTAAGKRLRLAPSTISAQLSTFEEALEVKLFQRVGRNIEPTEMGQLVFQYAEKIFSLGSEMLDSVKGLQTVGPLSLKVGIVDVVPKLVAMKLLEPARRLPEQVRLICHEGKDEQLLAELAMHNLDVVLTDTPFRSNLSVKVYNHLLGECGMTFFGVEKYAVEMRDRFPASLDDVPMLVPMRMSTLRGMLDQWLEKIGVQPKIVGEFDDNALLKVFGQAGEGVFAAPSVIENEVANQYQVKIIGRTDQITEKFYAISVERIIRHPAVAAISEAAKEKLFFRS